MYYREAAVHEFRKPVVNAVEEVTTAISTIEHVKKQIIEVNTRKSALNTAITDAQILYKYGEANYLKVLTIQQNYFQTALAYTVTIQKEINAYIDLYKSLGGD